MLGGIGSSTNDLPICTVLFELVDLVRYPKIRRQEIALVLRPQMAWSDDLRVAYDRTYPCTERSHSVTTFLESNCHFVFHVVWDYARDAPASFTHVYGVPAHSIRILPIHDHRPPFAGFPRELLRQIVSEAIRTGSENRWCSALLSYGTVCKSWAHVLDLFYATYCGLIIGMPTAVSVAKSLQYKPGNAKLIKRFSHSDYRETYLDNHDVQPMEDDEYEQACQSLLDILELVTHIREITIIATAESLLQRQICALHKLREITTCVIKGDRHSFRPEKPKRGSVTMNDVQSFIVHWPNLSDLNVTFCDAGEDKTE